MSPPGIPWPRLTADSRNGWPEATERMILLAEGDVFRDQLWVLLYPLPPRIAAEDAPAHSEPRFVWSPDSRHLLLLTRHSGVRTLAYLESG